MSRLAERVAQGLHEIADRATPSSTAWTSMARFVQAAPGKEVYGSSSSPRTGGVTVSCALLLAEPDRPGATRRPSTSTRSGPDTSLVMKR